MEVTEMLETLAEPTALLCRPHPGDWTYADLLAIPEDGPKCEIVEGNLVVAPSAAPRHQLAIKTLMRLVEAAGAPEDAVVFDVDVDLGRHVFRPDVLVLRPEAIGKDRPFAAGDLLLAVEVTSPSSRSMDRIIKPGALAEAGAPHYWRVDIESAPYIEVYELDGRAYRLTHTLSAGTSSRLEQPFPIEVDPAILVRAPH
jgi:Uma2 family endonuclease